LERRRTMMEWWSNHIAEQSPENKVQSKTKSMRLVQVASSPNI